MIRMRIQNVAAMGTRAGKPNRTQLLPALLRRLLPAGISGFAAAVVLSAVPRQILLAKPDAFAVGEELHYRIRLGPMTVGYSSMSVTERLTYMGRECYVFQTTASATPTISTFFPVRDRITSYWDISARRPLWMEKQLNEGNFHRNYEVRFDYPNRRALWKELRFAGNTKKAGELKKDAKWTAKEGITEDVPPVLQDMLSAIYFSRMSDAQGGPGDEFSMPVYDDLQVTSLKMVIRKREKLQLKVNDRSEVFDTLVTQPYIQTSGLFRSKGNLTIWISNDARRYPLKITAGIDPVGTVTTELVGVK